MHPYNSGVPRHLAKPRPKQAARLVALRKAAGLASISLSVPVGAVLIFTAR